MRCAQRTLLLLLIVALGAWLFYVGREHRVFLDNKTIERAGQTFKALKYVNVSVGGGAPVELMPRDRDAVAFVGPRVSVKVDVMDDFGEEVEKTVDLELVLGFKKDVMLSLPLLAAGGGGFLLPPPTAHSPGDAPRPASSDEALVPRD